MITRDSIQEKYGELVRGHVGEPAEEYLAAAAALGWELLGADVPIEDVVRIHQEALAELDEELSAIPSAELINQAFGPLMEMFMAYSLAMRERAAEHERARRADQQLIEARNAELEQANKKLRQTMAELLASQRRLLQSEKLAALGRLVAGVGHELNNPIMGILNYVQYCLDHTAQDDSRHSRLIKAVRELERCEHIISALRSYSHGSGDEPGSDPHPVDCHLLVRETVDLLNENFRQAGIEVAINVPEDLPTINTQSGALRQMLLNLLTNARDAVSEREPKEITVTATAEDGWVAISVADTGCGMSEEVINRVFDPFFTTKAVGEGTGLGMSMVQNLTQRLGGTIEVESKVGEGTVVTVHLPVDHWAVTGAQQPTGTDG